MRLRKGAASDPNFANVQLLTHCEGSNGGSSIVDVTGKTWTLTGATTSTAQKKWGTSSLLFNGSTHKAETATLAALDATGDFTAECWIYPVSFINDYACICSTDLSGEYWFMAIRASGQLAIGNLGSGVGNNSAGTLSLNTWSYVAMKKSGTTLSAVINGTSEISVTAANTQSGNHLVALGRNAALSGSPIAGYVDDFRYTVGVARNISVVPTAAFPDS